MRTYAGIGSRDITEEERQVIKELAQKLRKKYVCLTGNADGADAAFRDGADGLCVLILPWKNFNKAKDHKVLDIFVLGDGKEGLEAIQEFHPVPHKLSHGAKACIARNFYQIAGYDKYPEVSFVVCCSNSDGQGGVWGGTGHAVRIAKDRNIPFFNIREEGWRGKLNEFLDALA